MSERGAGKPGVDGVLTGCALATFLGWLLFGLLHPGLVGGGNPQVVRLTELTRGALRQPAEHRTAAIWGDLYRDPAASTALFVGLLVGLFVLYGIALRRAGRTGSRAVVVALLPLLLFLVPLFPTLPVFSTDVFTYVAVGEIADAPELNPYDVVIRDQKWAESLPYAPRSRHGSIYSPMASRLFQLLHVEGGSPWTQLLIVRGAMTAAIVAAVLLLIGASRAAGRPESRVRVGAVALAWSPLVLIEGVVSAHVDALILLLLAAGFWAIARGRERTGLALLALTASVKVVCLFMFPVLAVFAFHRAGGGSRGVRDAALLTVWTVGAYLIWLLPDWTGANPLGPLAQLSGLAGKSLTFSLRLLVRTLGGEGGVVLWGMRLLFVFVVLFRIQNVRTPQRLYERLSRDWLVYLLFFMPWLHPWYLVAAFAPVWMSARRDHFVTLLLFSATFLIANHAAGLLPGGWTRPLQLAVWAIGVLPASLFFLWSARADRFRRAELATAGGGPQSST